MQNQASHIELSEIDAGEVAAALMLELQVAAKKRGDVVWCVFDWKHDEYGKGRLNLNLSTTSNWRAAARKDLAEVFSLDWKSTESFELALVSSRVVGRHQLRVKD